MLCFEVFTTRSLRRGRRVHPGTARTACDGPLAGAGRDHGPDHGARGAGLVLAAVVVAGLLAVGAGPLHAAQGSAAADTVRPTWSWTLDQPIHVFAQTLNVTQSVAGADSTREAVEYDMRPEADGEGVLLRFTDVAFVGDSVPGTPEEELARRMSTLFPDWKIGRGGKLVGLSGTDGLVKRARAILDTLFADVPETTLSDFLRQAVNEDQMLLDARREWDGMVERWNGRDLVLGEFVREQSEEDLPLVSDTPVPHEHEFGAMRMVPCAADVTDRTPAPGPSGAADCVEFVLRSYPAELEMRRFMERFLEQMFVDMLGGEAPVVRVPEMRVMVETVLVADPDGLLPYRMRQTNSTRGRFEVENESAPFGSVIEVTYTFERR
ncbi:MAG: hypothetical protein D6701_01805 [Gemmatimonadetes bacterium]|nr:MAG: hypothetical protein D6701_01805 [Gemmatimonadota bacterium]